MKSLSQRLNEKLIINRNYKNADDIKNMFDNIEFTHPFRYTLLTSEDIFSMMVDYIRGNNIRSFSDFDSYKKTAVEGHNAYLAIFNKRIKEINVFQKKRLLGLMRISQYLKGVKTIVINLKNMHLVHCHFLY